MLRTLFFAAAGFLVVFGGASCAGPGPAEPAQPVRLALIDARSKMVLELVNEAHTSRLEQYSQIRESANRKVQTNEVVAELVDWMAKNQFERLAQAGAAPRGSEAATWSLELEQPSGVRHVSFSRNLAPADVEALGQLRRGYLEIWNGTMAGQSVLLKEGESPFDAPPQPKRK